LLADVYHGVTSVDGLRTSERKERVAA
jgi:hypothetical protein